jgi:hypothetical protein
LAVYGQNRRFAADVRAAAKGKISSLQICHIQKDPAPDCIALEPGSKGFSDVVGALKVAQPTIPPGKSKVTRERVLKIESLGGSEQCYRLLEFADFPDEYMSKVLMNRDCTQIVEYKAGYAVTRAVE